MTPRSTSSTRSRKTPPVVRLGGAGFGAPFCWPLSSGENLTEPVFINWSTRRNIMRIFVYAISPYNVGTSQRPTNCGVSTIHKTPIFVEGKSRRFTASGMSQLPQCGWSPTHFSILANCCGFCFACDFAAEAAQLDCCLVLHNVITIPNRFGLSTVIFRRTKNIYSANAKVSESP